MALELRILFQEMAVYEACRYRVKTAVCPRSQPLSAGQRYRNRIGGAKGIDGCAGEYARRNGIPLTEFLPDYRRYGKGAPFKRDLQIIDYADELLAFWDGHSRGTDFVIRQARLKKKKITVIRMDANP